MKNVVGEAPRRRTIWIGDSMWQGLSEKAKRVGRTASYRLRQLIARDLAEKP